MRNEPSWAGATVAEHKRPVTSGAVENRQALDYKSEDVMILSSTARSVVSSSRGVQGSGGRRRNPPPPPVADHQERRQP
ncbi:hypothetical protein BH24GEM2_BH24GEM2_17640 [soil metagenome]|jgi:hypothetical protein